MSHKKPNEKKNLSYMQNINTKIISNKCVKSWMKKWNRVENVSACVNYSESEINVNDTKRNEKMKRWSEKKEVWWNACRVSKRLVGAHTHKLHEAHVEVNSVKYWIRYFTPFNFMFTLCDWWEYLFHSNFWHSSWTPYGISTFVTYLNRCGFA